jgi:hypothetical protein
MIDSNRNYHFSPPISTSEKLQAVEEADSFPYKPRELAQLGIRAGVTNFLLAKTKANTAAKATAREPFVYGYMRSLRK